MEVLRKSKVLGFPITWGLVLRRDMLVVAQGVLDAPQSAKTRWWAFSLFGWQRLDAPNGNRRRVVERRFA